jgi:hypothetical protein
MTILWEFDEKHPKQVSAYGAKPHEGFKLSVKLNPFGAAEQSN